VTPAGSDAEPATNPRRRTSGERTSSGMRCGTLGAGHSRPAASARRPRVVVWVAWRLGERGSWARRGGRDVACVGHPRGTRLALGGRALLRERKGNHAWSEARRGAAECAGAAFPGFPLWSVV
jgi:hypothetical protein